MMIIILFLLESIFSGRHVRYQQLYKVIQCLQKWRGNYFYRLLTGRIIYKHDFILRLIGTSFKKRRSRTKKYLEVIWENLRKFQSVYTISLSLLSVKCLVHCSAYKWNQCLVSSSSIWSAISSMFTWLLSSLMQFCFLFYRFQMKKKTDFSCTVRFKILREF